MAEPGLGILAISLPALFQFFKRAWQYGPRSLLSSHDYSQIDSRKQLKGSGRVDHSNGSGSHPSQSVRKNSAAGESRAGLATSYSGRGSNQKTFYAEASNADIEEDEIGMRGIPLGSIRVRKDVDVGYNL